MDSQFNVVFTGELKPGTDKDAFITTFSQRFQCSEEKAASIVNGGKAVTLKNAVAKETAEKFRSALEAIGMEIRLEPLPAKDSPFQVEPPQESTQASSSQSTPSTPEFERFAPSNPYETPQADLHQSYDEGEMTGPVSVPFGHGASWIGTAFSNHFKQNAMAWIGALIVFIILSMVMQLIPLLGALAYALLYPVFIGGFMLGARAQDEGEDFTVGHLFSAFSQSTGQLILLGVTYLILSILIMVVIGFTMGGAMMMFSMAGAGDPAAAEAMMQDPSVILLPFLVMALVSIPLMMAYWFAPALIAIDGVSALSAMKMSFLGCMKNILPFLLYGIVMFILMFVAAIPLLLGYLVLLPVMFASMYTAYRDIYYPEA